MADYLPRSAWGARPPEPGPGLLTVSRVIGTAVHWPGTTSSTPIAKDRVDEALRGWQNYHMDDRGWSDIAYQVAVDQWGRAWTLRGLLTQSGANGDTEVNEEYGAVLLVLVQGEEPTAAMKATVREVMADYRDIFPNWEVVVGHFQIRPVGTDCPGPAAKRALAAGEFNPRTTTPSDTGLELTMGQYENIMAKLDEIDLEATGRYKVEADRYQFYAAKFAEILRAEAADAATAVTDADVDRILAKIEELKPAATS